MDEILLKKDIPKQKLFTKKQLNFIYRFKKLMDRGYDLGLVAHGQGDLIIIYREDSHSVAFLKQENDKGYFPFNGDERKEELISESISSLFFRDSGADDTIYYK